MLNTKDGKLLRGDVEPGGGADWLYEKQRNYEKHIASPVIFLILGSKPKQT